MVVVGVLTRGKLTGWILLLTAFSAAVAGAVGWIGAPVGHGFDWNLGAVAATATGTTLLAGFTGALAWTTSGDVRATWELAELTRQEQASRDKPFVIASLMGVRFQGLSDDDVGNAFLAVELFNAGLGPALEIDITGEHSSALVLSRSLPALIPNERFPWGLYLEVIEEREEIAEDLTRFQLAGTYSDRHGNHHEIVVRIGAE